MAEGKIVLVCGRDRSFYGSETDYQAIVLPGGSRQIHLKVML
jgi:hypothetical protein